MMTEGQVRQLLETLDAAAKSETNPLRVVAYSGGVSALKMVLEEDE